MLRLARAPRRRNYSLLVANVRVIPSAHLFGPATGQLAPTPLEDLTTGSPSTSGLRVIRPAQRRSGSTSRLAGTNLVCVRERPW